jgi:hypothetical protein
VPPPPTAGLKKYLIYVTNSHHRKALTKLRISAHDLAIERGRYKGQNLEERICSQCSSDEVEDEIHFVTKCIPIFFFKTEPVC